MKEEIFGWRRDREVFWIPLLDMFDFSPSSLTHLLPSSPCLISMDAFIVSIYNQTAHTACNEADAHDDCSSRHGATLSFVRY